jgi:hypothetical protein
MNGPVLCRCRIDHLYMATGRILDLKKVRNAHPRKVARNFVDYGYDIQYAAYQRALQALRPELLGRTQFTFLFLELTAPYHVVPERPDGAFREIGKLRWLSAVTLWERCLATGHWPGYCGSGETLTIEAPAYIVQQELGNVYEPTHEAA